MQREGYGDTESCGQEASGNMEQLEFGKDDRSFTYILLYNNMYNYTMACMLVPYILVWLPPLLLITRKPHT